MPAFFWQIQNFELGGLTLLRVVEADLSGSSHEKPVEGHFVEKSCRWPYVALLLKVNLTSSRHHLKC